MNRLATEPSPYLRQHADNPVDWWPWGEEAFAEARRQDKPIFLSIGYSTCHWCHVMAHESFENPAIAGILNREFIPVKVDREERPDVDRVYMTFVQATTGAGGWPMSVWLTPALAPFFGGTYFPPTARWNRPGFTEVLEQVARAWRDRRQEVESSAADVLSRLQSFGGGGGTQGNIASAAALEQGVAQFRAVFDARHGGFGDAPKFPRPSELLFLLREHARTGHMEPRDMALHTLRAMAEGGMRDHVGGGFHRYSVDAEWRVPHFEKMLYDQAQLTLALLEAAQAGGDPYFAHVANDTLQYVAREMTDEAGAFYSAEDADSLPPEEGHAAHPVEGAFYTWSAAELRARLGDDYEVFARRFGVEEGGNAPFDPQGEFQGKNLLYIARTLEQVSEASGRDRKTVVEALERARLALFAARLARPRPHLDDKVLAGWNGLMIAAFARAARVLAGDAFGLGPALAARHLSAAQRAAAAVRTRLWDEARGRLSRRHRAGQTGIDAYAEDYACLTWGLLELFQADGDSRWLTWAQALQRALDERFWDEQAGGWFSTSGDDPSVLIRLKEDYDGAEPAASSVAALNLLMLSHLQPDETAERRVRRTLERYGEHLAQAARIVPLMMAALSSWHAGMGQAVVAGDPAAPDTMDLQRALAAHYRPFLLTIPPAGGAALPFTSEMRPVDGRAAVYLCRDFRCEAPVTSAAELRRRL